MGDILSAAKAYVNLLDVEYQFILGKKNKNIVFSVFFDENHFFHLAGLQYLKDRMRHFNESRGVIFRKILSGIITQNQLKTSAFFPQIKERIEYLAYLEQIMDSNETIFKYNPKLESFSAIQADFLLKNELCGRNIFTFLSQEKSSGKYFCRSFFPQTDKDYSENQTTWTLLYKKKIRKSDGSETVLCDRLRA